MQSNVMYMTNRSRDTGEASRVKLEHENWFYGSPGIGGRKMSETGITLCMGPFSAGPLLA